MAKGWVIKLVSAKIFKPTGQLIGDEIDQQKLRPIINSIGSKPERAAVKEFCKKFAQIQMSKARIVQSLS